MRTAWKVAVITLMLNFSLLSHGQDPEASSPSIPYAKLKSLSSPLNGNWHVTGRNAPMARWQLPFLSLAIEVDGDKLYGQGDVVEACQEPLHVDGETIFFTGQIASDGTFEANAERNRVRYSIHGTMPAPGDATWQGTYTMKNISAESDCIIDESVSFSATRYAPFVGEYSGTLTHNRDQATAVAVTVQVTQGEVGNYEREGLSIPLGAQIKVSGVPCFAHAIATKTRDNHIQGDHFSLTFLMEDGALLHLWGNRFFDESDESTVKLVRMWVEGGQCGRLTWTGALTLR